METYINKILLSDVKGGEIGGSMMELREAFEFTITKNIFLLIAFIVVLLSTEVGSINGILLMAVVILNVYIGTSVVSYLDSMLTKEKKVYLLLGLFIGALAAANLLGSKVATFWGMTVSVAIFSYPLTFLITDGIAEVYGKKKTWNFVWAGFLSQVLIFLLILLSIKLPPATRYGFNSEFVTVFAMSMRMIVASVIAFLFSQLHDIWAFHFWKRVTKGKYLWLRNNMSTIASQLIDSLLFMFIAFYHLTPKFTAAFVLSITIPYWVLKIIMALIDTPFCYLVVSWLKKGKDEKEE